MANNIKHKNSNKYNKHLTFDDRISIQNIIATNRNLDGSLKIKLNDIANMLEKDPSTISKEIKKHRIIRKGNKVVTTKNICLQCDKKDTCQNKNKTITACDDFVYITCLHLKHFPWICDGCSKKSRCHRDKYFYYPKASHEAYKAILVDSRNGINITKEEFDIIDKLISTGVNQGKSIDVIVQENKYSIPFSTRRIYEFIKAGYFSIKPMDTRRMAKMKPRKNKNHNSVVIRQMKINHSYIDYQAYIKEHPDANIFQMDTVEGNKGGKVLLTLLHPDTKFQIAILLDHKTSSCVVDALNEINDNLGDKYKELFEVILTDNGSEFYDIDGISKDPSGEGLRTNLFFCDPGRSDQKGACEKNHTHIRYILQKGKSFDNLTQDDVNLMMSHINSYKRKSTEYSSPYERFCAFFGKNCADALGITQISSEDINLTPSLLK